MARDRVGFDVEAIREHQARVAQWGADRPEREAAAAWEELLRVQAGPSNPDFVMRCAASQTLLLQEISDKLGRLLQKRMY